jgi:AcrR family transcriptional regulator
MLICQRALVSTKASIHHHFPTKDVLGEQVVIQARYQKPI